MAGMVWIRGKQTLVGSGNDGEFDSYLAVSNQSQKRALQKTAHKDRHHRSWLPVCPKWHGIKHIHNGPGGASEISRWREPPEIDPEHQAPRQGWRKSSVAWNAMSGTCNHVNLSAAPSGAGSILESTTMARATG